MNQQMLQERFFEALIHGRRNEARNLVDDCLAAQVPAENIVQKLFWPVYEEIEKLHRADQMSNISHHFATRLLRMLVDQMQIRFETDHTCRGPAMVMCGPDDTHDLAGQLTADLLEASGYEVYFAGGGVANDEVVAQVGELQPRALVMFGNVPSDLPYIRTLIDELRGIGKCPGMRIAVGGGVFNRAEGLAQELGADLWAASPFELVEKMNQAMIDVSDAESHVLGRKRRIANVGAA